MIHSYSNCLLRFEAIALILTKVFYDSYQTTHEIYRELGWAITVAPNPMELTSAKALDEHIAPAIKFLANVHLHHCDEIVCRGRKCIPESAHWDSIFDGSHPTIVMAGRVSRNLVIIRCMDKYACDYKVDELEDLNIDFYAYPPKDGMAGALFFKSKMGEVKNKRLTDDIEVLGCNGKYIHLPSYIEEWDPNHSANLTKWKMSSLGPKKLSKLNIELTYQRYDKYEEQEALQSLPSWAHKLSRANQETLVDFDAYYRSDDNNRQKLFALIYDMVGHQVPLAIALETFMKRFNDYAPNHSTREGRDFLSGMEEWLIEVLEKAYSKPKEPAVPEPTEAWAIQHKALREWADTYPWTGRTRHTDRLIFEALLDRQKMERSLEFRAALSELVKLSHKSKPTVSAAIKRFIEMGILEHVGQTDLDAWIYRFNWMEGKNILLRGKTLPVNNSILSSIDNKIIDSIEESELPVKFYPAPLYIPQSDEDFKLIQRFDELSFRIIKHLSTNSEDSIRSTARSLGEDNRNVRPAMNRLEALGLLIHGDKWHSAKPEVIQRFMAKQVLPDLSIQRQAEHIREQEIEASKRTAFVIGLWRNVVDREFNHRKMLDKMRQKKSKNPVIRNER